MGWDAGLKRKSAFLSYFSAEHNYVCDNIYFHQSNISPQFVAFCSNIASDLSNFIIDVSDNKKSVITRLPDENFAYLLRMR